MTKEKSFLIPTISALVLLTVGGIFLANNKRELESNKVIDKTIQQTANFLIKDWTSSPTLKDFPPPQVIPIAEGSKVYGACLDKDRKDSISHWEVGGSSYCGYTHSIYLVPEELKAFKDAFGPSSIAYVIAHEFGHALQVAYKVELEDSKRELQADCLAGLFIKVGSEELNITRDDVLSMAQAAYAIGSKSHGSGPQRRFALLSGMGVINRTCKEKDIIELADGKINHPALKELGKTRSGSGSIDTSVTPYPKTVNSALGL